VISGCVFIFLGWFVYWLIINCLVKDIHKADCGFSSGFFLLRQAQDDRLVCTVVLPGLIGIAQFLVEFFLDCEFWVLLLMIN
jgi:hypothetical protein